MPSIGCPVNQMALELKWSNALRWRQGFIAGCAYDSRVALDVPLDVGLTCAVGGPDGGSSPLRPLVDVISFSKFQSQLADRQIFMAPWWQGGLG